MPSTGSLGRGAPVRRATVGSTSMVPAMPRQTAPRGMRPGKRARNGSRRWSRLRNHGGCLAIDVGCHRGGAQRLKAAGAEENRRKRGWIPRLVLDLHYQRGAQRRVDHCALVVAVNHFNGGGGNANQDREGSRLRAYGDLHRYGASSRAGHISGGGRLAARTGGGAGACQADGARYHFPRHRCSGNRIVESIGHLYEKRYRQGRIREHDLIVAAEDLDVSGCARQDSQGIAAKDQAGAVADAGLGNADRERFGSRHAIQNQIAGGQAVGIGQRQAAPRWTGTTGVRQVQTGAGAHAHADIGDRRATGQEDLNQYRIREGAPRVAGEDGPGRRLQNLGIQRADGWSAWRRAAVLRVQKQGRNKKPLADRNWIAVGVGGASSGTGSHRGRQEAAIRGGYGWDECNGSL